MLDKQEEIYNLSAGACQKNIVMDDFNKLEIPIPSIEVQQKIVEQLDVIYKNIQTSKEQIEESKKIMKFYVETMTLWEKDDKLENQIIFESKNKKLKASDGNNSGKYKFITSSQDRILYRDDYEFEKKHIILGRGGNASIHCLDKFGISHDDCYVLSSNKQKLEYIYYYLYTNKDSIEKGFVGSTIKHLSKSFINDMLIKVPSLEKQKEIVSQCEEIDGIIKSMESRIKSNKILMKNIMETYLKTNDKNKDEKKSDKQIDNSDDDKEIDQKPVKKFKTKNVKKVESTDEESSSSDSSSESEPDEKPKKKLVKKKL